MIKIFRNKINSHYWENRWESSGVDNFTFTNENIYPIKYANLVVKRGCKILEAGCGSGRYFAISCARASRNDLMSFRHDVRQ